MEGNVMNGAESLVRTLVTGGVDICFTNPGTSEMHFCAALDKVDGMRCILGLFEGVVTGAADGYGRMKDGPAATLLQRGPDWETVWPTCTMPESAHTHSSHSWGDAPTTLPMTLPLTADIEGIARPVSDWV